MGPEFWQTLMGRKLIEGDIPRIARSLERIAEVLERSNGNFNTVVQRQAAEMMKAALDSLKGEASATEKGTEPPDPDTIWYCADCGDENVEVRMWVVANTGELQDDCDEGTAFCPKCQGHVKLDSKPRYQSAANPPVKPSEEDLPVESSEEEEEE